jgi:hypothetical protein
MRKSYFGAYSKIMKQILTLSFCCMLLMLAGCGASGKSGSKNKGARVMPEGLAAAYRTDATRLAARELSTSRTSTMTEGDLPQDRIEYFYSLLTKIYWMTVDSANIPDLSSIHTFPTPDLRRVRVFLRPNSDLIANWSQGITTSSDLYLNQLLSRYGVTLEDYRTTAAGPSVVLVANRDVSTGGLAESLRHNLNFKSAEAVRGDGDGNNIEWGGEGKNQLALRLSIGHGDCPSGCIHRKYWIFYISETGDVTFMGTRGEIPAELEPQN